MQNSKGTKEQKSERLIKTITSFLSSIEEKKLVEKEFAGKENYVIYAMVDTWEKFLSLLNKYRKPTRIESDDYEELFQLSTDGWAEKTPSSQKEDLKDLVLEIVEKETENEEELEFVMKELL